SPREPPIFAAPARVTLRFAGLLALIASFPSIARAQMATEAIRVEFSAPKGCPTESAFVAEIEARTARARIVRSGDAVRSFIVTVREEQGRSVGDLVIVDPRTSTATRRLGGASCAEVTSALALVTALAIDPKASMEPSPDRRAPALAPTPP